MTPTGPTTRRRQLGALLRRLREASGATLEEAGAAADTSRSTAQRYEGPSGPVRWPVVDALARFYGASEADRALAVELAKNAKVLGWYTDADIPDALRTLIMLEDESSELHFFSAGYVPGLVQTRAYAIAAHRASEPRADESELERMVDVRIRRQSILEREAPPHVWMILDEAVIRRQVGGPAVMAEQMAHLAECARNPRITVQVLPFARGANSAECTGFVMVRGADQALDVVYLGQLTSSVYLEKPADLERYRIAWDYLRADALSTPDSTELIAGAAEGYAKAAKEQSKCAPN
ncbi:helix-turn-helix domain-containing protein [Streptomyces sp. NRRL WC-3742]|uniref:helix-turn-helix domain-containing protein n=1 Tax=Streptomyces sp. NRRL WC-3742 TaxID=1463934 RepID=UPI00068BD51F|nr:helix-turn-helix transcriptional regulator [Streptomyces sp. NRRL WC-3742]